MAKQAGKTKAGSVGNYLRESLAETRKEAFSIFPLPIDHGGARDARSIGTGGAFWVDAPVPRSTSPPIDVSPSTLADPQKDGIETHVSSKKY